MTPPATAATTSSARPGSVSCSSSFPTPNNAPYTSTQPAIQSIRLARPPADGRTSGARAATGPQPAREGRVRRHNATHHHARGGGAPDGAADHADRGQGTGAGNEAAKASRGGPARPAP